MNGTNSNSRESTNEKNKKKELFDNSNSISVSPNQYKYPDDKIKIGQPGMDYIPKNQNFITQIPKAPQPQLQPPPQL